MPNGDRFKKPWQIPFEEYEKPSPLTFYEGAPYDVRAGYDQLGRLQAYLQNLVNTDPAFTSQMAASIWQGVYDQLFPQPEWKERKPTEEERRAGAPPDKLIGEWAAPTPKPIIQTALWAKVQTYFTGLVPDVRAEEEARIAQYAEAQSTLITQAGALPLKRGGTAAEQMWTAEEAIRNLRLQQQQVGIAAQTNPYLASTARLMEQQVGQLRTAQGTLREQARTEARIATGQAPPTGETTEQRIARWQRPPIPTPEVGGFQESLAGMPSGMQGYFSGRLGQIWDEFEQAFPGARQSWWEALNPAPTYETGEPGTTAQQFAGQYGVPVERTGAMGLRYLGGADRGEFAGLPLEQRQGLAWVGAEAQGGEPRMAPAKARDPWETFLSQYPYVSKFMAEPPRTRGFYPAKYSPRTRWFS